MHDTLQVAVHPTGPGSCRVTVAGDLDLVSAPDIRKPSGPPCPPTTAST